MNTPTLDASPDTFIEPANSNKVTYQNQHGNNFSYPRVLKN